MLNYKKNIVLVCFLLAFGAFNAKAQKTEILKKETIVNVALLTGVASNVKDTVMAEVTRDVVSDSGSVLIPAGTLVEVRVVKRSKARSWGRPGKIALQFVKTRSVDKQAIPLKGIYMRQGGNKYVQACGLSVVGGLFTGVGALAGFFIKGEEVVVQPNAVIYGKVFVPQDIEIQVK
jgi:hypothetical protein